MTGGEAGSAPDAKLVVLCAWGGGVLGAATAVPLGELALGGGVGATLGVFVAFLLGDSPAAN